MTNRGTNVPLAVNGLAPPAGFRYLAKAAMQFRHEARPVAQDQLVLPDPYDAPPSSTQCPSNTLVPCLVGRQFLMPERPVVGRLVEVLRAAVPKTTVHEHRNPQSREHKVRSAGDRVVTTPACDSLAAENVAQDQLSILVSATLDPRHHLRALLSGEHIGANGRMARPLTWRRGSPLRPGA